MSDAGRASDHEVPAVEGPPDASARDRFPQPPERFRAAESQTAGVVRTSSMTLVALVDPAVDTPASPTPSPAPTGRRSGATGLRRRLRETCRALDRDGRPRARAVPHRSSTHASTSSSTRELASALHSCVRPDEPDHEPAAPGFSGHSCASTSTSPQVGPRRVVSRHRVRRTPSRRSRSTARCAVAGSASAACPVAIPGAASATTPSPIRKV